MIFQTIKEKFLSSSNILTEPLWRKEQLLSETFVSFDISVPDDIIHRMCIMPASRKYHGNHEGGLLEHSINVTLALAALSDQLELEWQNDRSFFVVGMLHDLCKIDLYEIAEDGSIHYSAEAAPGHGEKSVMLARSFIPDLTEEEEMCIRWHMGAFDEKENWSAYGDAVEKYPNVLFAHTADMIAARILEKERSL